jgi:hypothetical protein
MARQSEARTIHADTMTHHEVAIHDYGTGEKLPIRMPVFEPSGNATERYRIALGFYGTGDSTAWILSSEQFRDFLRIQALGQLSPSLLQILIPQGVIGEAEVSSKQKLLQRILALRDSIEAEKGILPESYPLLHEDRER